MFLNMEEYSRQCKEAEETLKHFDDRKLDKIKQYVKKVAELDPADPERKFESMEEFDKYMIQYHLAFTDLVNEASKPKVNAALGNVSGKVVDETREYDRKMDERTREISVHKGDPDYVAPPEPEKPDLYRLNLSFFN